MGRICFEYRVSDKMITTQHQAGGASIKDAGNMFFNIRHHGFGKTVIEFTITVINHGQTIKGIKVPGPGASPGNTWRNCTDRTWSECPTASTRPKSMC